MKEKISKYFLLILQSPYIMLLLISLIAYGVLIPWLGLYADDLTFIWTFEILKENGILRYFTYGGNRPVWGLFYSFFVPLLGNQPEVWHLFGIFWLWVCGLLISKLIILIFPKQNKLSLILGSLFIVYPGMQLQFISLTFGHMWLIYAFYLISLIFSILSITKKKYYLPFTFIAILTSTVNLLSFEYFIMLEGLRPLIFWLVYSQKTSNFKYQIFKIVKIYFPYLLLLFGVIIWRLFFFELQTIRYQISIIDHLKSEPINTILNLIPIIFKNIFWSTTTQAWGKALAFPVFMDWNSRLNIIYFLVVLVLVFGIFYWLRIINFQVNIDKKFKTILIVVGLLGLFFAGWPFWVTNLEVEPNYWNSRFTMPFMIGMVFVLGGLISFIPKGNIQKLIVSLLLGFAIGFQFQIANDFRRDWIRHNEILWQLSWRLGGLEEGTLILSNDLPIKYQSDNTFSAELNWISAKGEFRTNPDYLLGYASELRRYGIPFDEKSVNIKKDMISSTFFGNTDKLIGIYYKEGSCLRILDSRLDPHNPFLKEEIKHASILSNENLINPIGKTFDLKPSIYGYEPTDNECYKFQKVGLLKQMQKWEEINQIAEQIDFRSNIIRKDPMLTINFLESYLYTNEFDKAYYLSKTINEITPLFSPVLCKYWFDLNEESLQFLPNDINDLLDCNSAESTSTN